MFGRKKSEKISPEVNTYIQKIIIGIPTRLYLYTVGNQTGSELTAKLYFDDQQRVSSIGDLKVNGALKMPSAETFEPINELTMPLASMPPASQVSSMDIKITKDGKIESSFEYKLKA